VLLHEAAGHESFLSTEIFMTGYKGTMAETSRDSHENETLNETNDSPR